MRENQCGTGAEREDETFTLSVREILKSAVDTYGVYHQLAKAIEEASEKICEMAKILEMLASGGVVNTEKLAEEIADDKIVTAQIVDAFGIEEDVEVMSEYKIKRLKRRIERRKEND